MATLASGPPNLAERPAAVDHIMTRGIAGWAENGGNRGLGERGGKRGV